MAGESDYKFPKLTAVPIAVDMNSEGCVDIRDLVKIKKLSAYGEYLQSADLIPDTEINAFDIAKLRECLFLK